MLRYHPSIPRKLLLSAQASSFIDGWRALPEELKFRILILAVAPEESRHGMLQMSYHHIGAARYWNQHPFRGLTVSLLSCPQMKPLVLEAFYTQNTFLLDYSLTDYNLMPPSTCTHLPPHDTYRFIRRLQLRFGLMSKEKFQLLEKAASGTSKLENLTFLDIRFQTPDNCPASSSHIRNAKRFKDYLDSTGSIWFESKYLRVTYEHYPIGGDYRRDHWEDDLLDKLTLHPLVGPVETSLTHLTLRYSNGINGDKLREVDSWERSRGFHHDGRWTVKEIVVQDGEHRLEPYTRYDQKFGLV